MINGGNGKFSIYEGGEVVFIKDIQFKNRFADHASLTGRPCIILSEFDDKITMLPLTSRKPKNDSLYIERIAPKDFVYTTNGFKVKDEEYVNLLSLFQRDLRYYDVVSRITLRRYLKLLLEMEKKRLFALEQTEEAYNSAREYFLAKKEEIELTLNRK